MKKSLFMLLLISGFMFKAFGQQAIKVGPLGFILGNYNIRYEKGISEKGSFQVGANFYNYKLFGLKTTGYGADAGYRHYFKEAIRGGYVSPSLSYQTNTTSVSASDDTSGSFSLLGIGATAGYQWVSGGNFVFDVGLGYRLNAQIIKSDVLNKTYGGGGLRFTFALGYAF